MNVDELSAADVLSVHLLEHLTIVFWNFQFKFIIRLFSIRCNLLKIVEIRRFGFICIGWVLPLLFFLFLTNE